MTNDVHQTVTNEIEELSVKLMQLSARSHSYTGRRAEAVQGMLEAAIDELWPHRKGAGGAKPFWKESLAQAQSLYLTAVAFWKCGPMPIRTSFGAVPVAAA